MSDQLEDRPVQRDFLQPPNTGSSVFRKLPFTGPAVAAPSHTEDSMSTWPATSDSFFDHLYKGAIIDNRGAEGLPRLEDMLQELEAKSCGLAEQFAQMVTVTKGQTKDVAYQTIFLLGLMREASKIHANSVQDCIASTTQLMVACSHLSKECEQLETLKAQLQATKEQLAILDKHVKKHCRPPKGK
eukprot:g47707.t1